jgi:protease-4
MINFFKKILVSTLTTVISFFIIVFIFIGIAIISSDSSNDKENIAETSILKIDFKNKIVDRGSNELKLEDIINESTHKIGLNQILTSINNAKKDDRIKGIYLNIENVTANPATLEEIRNKLQEFKDSTDKFIVSYSETYSQNAYFLSSTADKIYMHPEGILEFKGLAYQGMFFKNALQKLEIEAQIIRHGKFKSAVEPFMLDKMSSSNRLQTSKFINSIWTDIKNEISEDRPVYPKQIDAIAQDFLIQKAEDAITHKFVDHLVYKDQLIDSLKAKLNLKSDQKINFVSLETYKNSNSENKKYSKNKIAVIYASGEIKSGKGDAQTIGSEGLSKSIRKARLDDKVKAIVLRVNSPGGSALASETILREMALAKDAKPVVVSMGDVAASGGYYIACQADTIVANPTTITGSIGVFGVLMNAQKMINNKLGVTIDTVKTNTYSDLGSVFRPLTNNERNIIQNSVENVYDTFISRVSKGRSISKEMVDDIGQGRVWTGRDALEIGLVDVLGGLEDAISIAEKMANLNDYRIVNLPKIKDPLEKMIEELMNGQVKNYIIKSELGEFYKPYMELKNINKIDKIQMRMPTQFQIN